jgi:hypothetical protein
MLIFSKIRVFTNSREDFLTWIIFYMIWERRQIPNFPPDFKVQIQKTKEYIRSSDLQRQIDEHMYINVQRRLCKSPNFSINILGDSSQIIGSSFPKEKTLPLQNTKRYTILSICNSQLMYKTHNLYSIQFTLFALLNLHFKVA